MIIRTTEALRAVRPSRLNLPCSECCRKFWSSPRLFRGKSEDEKDLDHKPATAGSSSPGSSATASAWEFLSDSSDSSQSKNPHDFELKTQFDDFYASRKSSRPKTMVRSKLSFVVDDNPNPPISGKEISRIFRPHRPLETTEFSARTKGPTRKEEAIFHGIFDSIMLQKNPGQSSKSNNKAGMSPGMQTLFEEVFSGSTAPFTDDSADSGVKMTVPNEDVRRFPLSIGSIMMKDRHGIKARKLRQEELNVLNKQLEPIYQHISSLESDYQVMEYLTETIFKALDPKNIKSIKRPLKNSKDSSEATQPQDPLNPKFEDSEALSMILAKGMQVLRTVFKSPTQILSLPEICKRRGLEFYVVSCNVDVYNEALRTRWEYYKDLFGVENLYSEMEANGVAANSETVEILGAVAQECSDMKQALVGLSSVSLWSQEDENRVRYLNENRMRIQKELMAKDNTRQVDMIQDLFN